MLKEFVGEENLPINYGGLAPALSPAIHPYAETMKDYTGEVEIVPTDVIPLVEPDSAADSTESKIHFILWIRSEGTLVILFAFRQQKLHLEFIC